MIPGEFSSWASGNLSKLQTEVSEWSQHNFGNQSSVNPLLGVGEEIGELAEEVEHASNLILILGRLHHAYLKRGQDIRRTENHSAAIRDAVGDIIIYLLDFCHRENVSLERCVIDAWNEVSKRDWVAERKSTGRA